ncbi:MAG: hypothetical protein ACOC9V_04645 [Chloroflexota bacterium]
MKHARVRMAVGYGGLLLVALGFLLGFGGRPILGWIVVGLGGLLITLSLYTGDRPFIAF